ncbi:MAG: DNA translocase FtsK 4TM domain-containing protein [Ilumatobacteraceae bacterium]
MAPRAKKRVSGTRTLRGSQRARTSSSDASGHHVRTHDEVDPSVKFRVAQSEPVLKPILAERAGELMGMFFVVLGVLLSLSVYVSVVGPVGRGLDTALRWTVGLGRFALPLVCLGLGVALLKRVSIEHRVRLTFGWLVVSVAILGAMHVFLAANELEISLGALEGAGGWLGWLVGEPLESSLSPVGAVVILIPTIVLGLMLATAKSLPDLARAIADFVKGLDNAARRYRDGGTNNEPYDAERDGGVVAGMDDLDAARREHEAAARGELYDHRVDGDFEGDAEEDVPAEPERKVRKRLRTPKPEPTAKPAAAAKPVRAEQQQMPLGPGAQPSSWNLPSLDMLALTSNKRANEDAVAERGDALVAALSSHGVDTKLVGFTRGPTVTRYELELGEGIKVARLTSLSKDIAYAMAAVDVRILAPIPGRSAIGIEVPNDARDLVSLGDLLTAPEAKSALHPLEVGVGKDIAGRPVFLNISTTPHLLIAGATGAGKSSVLNCIITSILMRTTPEQVRLILIDPKQVEMGQYAGLPHLLTQPVTVPKKAANALGWAVKEMERRYDVLVEAGFRDISGYNAAYDRGELNSGDDTAAVATKKFDRMPFIVVVVDELNDLMMVAARDVEECITRIAQKARAVGIHLIVATQRPSVNVITGVIKANIPARMAFAVSSLTDSRVILDQPGAEKLVGKGDLLMLPGNTSVAQRVQSAWVGENEVRNITAHWKRQSPEVAYVSGIEGGGSGEGAGELPGGTTGDEDDDELLKHAIDLIVRTQLGSTSMLQRKLKVGFARAGRLMDLLEQRGIVGPSEGSKPREVLMTLEEWEKIQGS